MIIDVILLIAALAWLGLKAPGSASVESASIVCAIVGTVTPSPLPSGDVLVPPPTAVITAVDTAGGTVTLGVADIEPTDTVEDEADEMLDGSVWPLKPYESLLITPTFPAKQADEVLSNIQTTAIFW